MSGTAHFDPALGAWMLSSYADVSAALRDARLSGSGADAAFRHAQEAFRNAAAHALSMQRLAAWRVEMERSAIRCAEGLPDHEPVDLVAAFARPWATEVASIVSGASLAESTRLAVLAREIFLAAALATSAAPQPETHRAIADLSRSLSGPEPMIAVQTFVALSQTLPCVLASAWLHLLRHPDTMHQIRTMPGLVSRCVDELLRLASPSRAVFRTANADARIGAANIANGEHVILMLAAANLDPAQFADPTRLDPARGAAGHLALGLGMHPCLGAALVRVAVASATIALLQATTHGELSGEPEWLDGFSIRAPVTLPVLLRRSVSRRWPPSIHASAPDSKDAN